MEPELSTLSQKGSSCAVKSEKLRPNKTVRPPSHLNNSSMDAPEPTPQEPAAQSQPPPRTSYAGHVSAAQKNDQAALQAVSPSYNPHEHSVSKPGQQNQQLPACSSFARSLTSLQNQENAQLEHVCNAAVMSSVGVTSPSSRTQVSPPNQQVDAALPPSEIGRASCRERV